MTRTAFALLAATLFLCGCGGSQNFADGSQNWNFQAVSAVYPGFTFDIGGPLQNNAGTFEILSMAERTNELCFTAFPGQVTPISVTGNVSTTLVSQPQNGQVFTFTGNTYTVSGTCGTDHGAVKAILMNPIAGVYSGTMQNGSTLQVNLQQSAAADAQGMFHLTGTRTVVAGACGAASSVSISDPNTDTWLLGNQFLAVFSQRNVKTVISGSFNQSAKVLDVSVGTYGPNNCQSVTSGTLQ